MLGWPAPFSITVALVICGCSTIVPAPKSSLTIQRHGLPMSDVPVRVFINDIYVTSVKGLECRTVTINQGQSKVYLSAYNSQSFVLDNSSANEAFSLDLTPNQKDVPWGFLKFDASLREHPDFVSSWCKHE